MLEWHDGHHRRQPEIQVAVETPRGKEIDLCRQHQRRMVARRLDELLLAKAHALAQAQPVRGGSTAGGRDLHRPLAAKTAEVHGKHGLDLPEPDRLVRKARPSARVADQAMPGAADRFFELEEVQHFLILGGRPRLRSRSARP